jgi:hypothetical protein
MKVLDGPSSDESSRRKGGIMRSTRVLLARIAATPTWFSSSLTRALLLCWR